MIASTHRRIETTLQLPLVTLTTATIVLIFNIAVRIIHRLLGTALTMSRVVADQMAALRQMMPG